MYLVKASSVILTASIVVLVHRSSHRGRYGREARMEIHILVPGHNGGCVLYLDLVVRTHSSIFIEIRGLTKNRLLPETLRAIAGNGSIPMSGVYRAWLPLVGPRTKTASPVKPTDPHERASINPFPILAYPDVVLSLIFAGVVHAVSYTITATIASAFSDVYPWLSQTVLGLSFLPTGLGMVLGSSATGKLLDWDYARIKKDFGDEKSLADFPKEYVRLRTMPAHLIVFVIAVIAWGWCIESRVHMAGPLVIQVFSEFGPLKHGRKLIPRSRMDFHLNR